MSTSTFLFTLMPLCNLYVDSFPLLNSRESENKARGDREDENQELLKDLLHRLEDKIETKFDVMDNKMSNVNHNIEELETKVVHKFEAMSSKENHMDHKLDLMESKMNRKIDDMRDKEEQTFSSLEAKMNRPTSESTWPMSSFWYWLLGLDVMLTVICRLL